MSNMESTMVVNYMYGMTTIKFWQFSEPLLFAIIIINGLMIFFILSRATYHRAPRYGGVRTWVEGLLARGNRALAEASNLMGYKNAQQDLSQ